MFLRHSFPLNIHFLSSDESDSQANTEGGVTQLLRKTLMEAECYAEGFMRDAFFSSSSMCFSLRHSEENAGSQVNNLTFKCFEIRSIGIKAQGDFNLK